MKKLLHIPFTFLSLSVFSQAVYTVGTPVNDSLNSVSGSDVIGCFPQPTFDVYPDLGTFPYATGVTLAFKITGITGAPPSAAPFGVLSIGDTLPLPGPQPNGAYQFFHPMGTGGVSFNLIAYGIPTVAGENYVCAWNTIMMTTALCNNAIMFLHDSVCTVQPFTGIENNTAQSAFEIYPNPTNGLLRITNQGELRHPKGGHPQGEITNVVIYDLLGEKVFTSPMTNDLMTIDVSSLPKGIYFVTVTADGNTVTQKLIIQ